MAKRKQIECYKTTRPAVLEAWDAWQAARAEFVAKCTAALAPFGAKPWFTKNPFALYGATFASTPDPMLWRARPGAVFAPRYVAVDGTPPETDAVRQALVAAWHPLTDSRINDDAVYQGMGLPSLETITRYNPMAVVNICRHDGAIYLQTDWTPPARWMVPITGEEFRAADRAAHEAERAAGRAARAQEVSHV